MRAILRLVCVLMLAGLPTLATAQLSGELAHKNLAMGCQDVGFKISAEKIVGALVKRKVRDLAELRLRSIGVWSDEIPVEPMRWLAVEIFYGAAIFVRTALYRGTVDTGNGQGGFVIVWENIGLIPWPRSATDIGVVETVSDHLDRFLIEYQRANPGCR